MHSQCFDAKWRILLSRIQPIRADFYPKPLRWESQASEQFANEARSIITSNDWNNLYLLAKQWTHSEPAGEIPVFLLLTSCQFASPPKAEELINLDLDSLRSWASHSMVKVNARWDVPEHTVCFGTESH